MQVVKIGLLGLGTVGQAVVDLSHDFGGSAFRVERAAVRNPGKPRSVTVPVTTDAREIIQDPAIDVVVEVAGGRHPARGWILEAMANGKAVVTANKELMAYHGPELIEASQTHNAYLAYEAAVGGGIPILDALRYHLSAAPIQQVYGVLNGTTNYLLNAMADGQSFRESLLQAQAAGFAEVDPSDDVGGFDTARKLVLLTYLAFGTWIDPDHLLVEGLTDWPANLLQRLNRSHLSLRLLAIARRSPDGTVHAQVRPTLVGPDSALAALKGSQNGVGIDNAAGRFWLAGPGAGGLPTALSVWSDIRRSQYFRPLAVPRATEQMAVRPVALPTLGVAVDPDRHLGSMGEMFQDPSLGFFKDGMPPMDGVIQFPWWDHDEK